MDQNTQCTPDEEVSIYSFDEFGDYFSAYVNVKKRHRSTYSFRGLAKRIGLRSPSTLVMIAKKQRLPSINSLALIGSAIGLTQHQQRYAEAIVALQTAKSPEEKFLFSFRKEALRQEAASESPELVQLRRVAASYRTQVQSQNRSVVMRESDWPAAQERIQEFLRILERDFNLVTREKNSSLLQIIITIQNHHPPKEEIWRISRPTT